MVDVVTTPMAQSGSAKTADEQKEHDAKMAKVADDGVSTIKSIDKRDGKETENFELNQQQQGEGEGDKPTDGVTKRPDDIPEKFWNVEKGEVNVEALLKSQKDGEDAIRAAAEKGKDTRTPEQITADDAAKAAGKPADGADKTTPADQGVAVNAASEEFAEKGELSADTYTKLESAGLSKEMVDEYIVGQQAIMSGLQSAAFGEFEGSKEAYDKASDWAVEKLSKDEIEALDVQITSRNPAIVKQGSAALAAKYAAGADIIPKQTITGQGNDANIGAHFKSSTEMRTAMADPKYKTDAAFRQDVANKIAFADKAGVNLFI